MASPRRTQGMISEIMRKVSSRGTSAELRFRSALDTAGIGYETIRDDLPGKPDLFIPEVGMAVFIDGDYWHGNQWRRRKLSCLEDQFPDTATKSYWLRKIRGNMARDCRCAAELIARGIRVLRLWESELRLRESHYVRLIADTMHAPPERSRLSVLPRKTVGVISFPGEGDGASHRLLIPSGIEDDDWTPALALCSLSWDAPAVLDSGSLSGLLDAVRNPPMVVLRIRSGASFSRKRRILARLLRNLNTRGYAVDTVLHACEEKRAALVITAVLCVDHADRSDAVPESPLRNEAMRAFIACHSEILWNMRPAPALMRGSSGGTTRDGSNVFAVDDDRALNWGAENPGSWFGRFAVYYLDPLVNELIHGAVLG